MFMNHECYGRDLRQLSSETLQTEGINLSYLISAYRAIGQKNFFGNPTRGRYWIDLLFGTDEVRKMIQSGKSESEIKDTWQKGIQEFMNLRSKYIIYPD